MTHSNRIRRHDILILCLLAVALVTAPSYAGALPERAVPAAGAIDVPVTIDVSVDEGTLARHGTTTVRVSIRASAALTGVRVRTAAWGNLEILEASALEPRRMGLEPDQGQQIDQTGLSDAAFLYRDALGAGEEISFTLPVRLNDYGESGLQVDVAAYLGQGFPFTKERELNIYLRRDRGFASNEAMVNLRREALLYDQRTARVEPKQFAKALAELNQVDTASADEIVDVAPPNPNRRSLHVEPARATEIESESDDLLVGPKSLSTNINVFGTVQYVDENGIAHPVFGYAVEVRDDDLIGSDLLASVATDTNGNYNVIVAADDPDGPDIFVRFKPVNSLIEVRPLGLGSYENDTAVTENVGSNVSLERNITFAATGNGPVASVLSGMTYIAVYARDFLNGGVPLAQIPVEFPGTTNAAFYDGSKINMRPNDRFDWDVMHHEYGHYVQDTFNFENNPGGAHNIGECLSVIQGGTANVDKSAGVRFAWGEGWPTYFGTSGQMRLGLTATEAPRVGDAVYADTVNGFGGFSYSLETNSNNLGGGGDARGLGEDNEVTVQRIFYDLFDTNSDSRDNVSRIDLDLFNVLRNSGVTTLSGAWGLVRASGLIAGNADDLAFGAITTDHAVGPQPLLPGSAAIVTTANANFSWAANVGCSGTFAGNNFDLVFFDADTFAKILTIPNLATTSTSLSPAQLSTLIAANHEVLWAVEGSNTASPATGPYLGDNTLIVVNTPPEADAGPDQSVECASPTTVSLNGTGSSDADGDTLTYSWSAPGIVFDNPTSATPTADFPLGSTVVTLTVSDGIQEDSDTMEVTVVDTTPPVISCPANVTIECTGDLGVSADDPQLVAFFGGVSATDACDSNPAITHDAPPFFMMGDTTVTFTAMDASGNSSSCSAIVTVVDTTPPEISASLDETVLWPPDHKMVEINATVEVTDICDPSPTFVLTSITSSEPDNAVGNGDGNTVDDIQGADFGTADTSFLLRAERAATGGGRVYTVTYTAIDSSGNMTDSVVEVVVPHRKP
jgi:hypothetical protein